MVILNRETTGKDIVSEFGINAKGKSFLVTGPSEGGLGAELLTTLAHAEPAHFILAGRNESKIAPVIKKINEINPAIKTTFVELDLLDNASVRQAATEINDSLESIDVLINNAGIAARRQFELSKDGVEQHFAANYLGHFLLTNLLVDKISKVKGMVINVSSMAYTLAEANTEDPNFNEGKEYHAWVAYARSKTANILFTYALAEKYGDRFANLVIDPGMAHDSQLLVNSEVDEAFLAEGFKLAASRAEGKEIPQTVLVTMQQGIATALWVALDPSVRGKGPAFLKECNVLESLPYASDEGEALKLWELSERLSGEKFEGV